MEELVLKALDQGGTLTLSLIIVWFGGKKLDKIEILLHKLVNITALTHSSKETKKKVRKILNGDK